jgi:hypothetical protein
LDIAGAPIHRFQMENISMTKRKVTSDNAFIAGLAQALGIGAGSVAQQAVGRNLSADSEEGIAEIVALATENLDAAQLRRLGEALIASADDADKGGGERQRAAMDSAWGRRKPADAFSRRFPSASRIRRAW